MSFKFGGGGGTPYIPPPPPPPANPATLANADVQQAGLNKSRSPNTGLGGTIATAPQGLAPTQTPGKQLLGQ